jgi:hypothetical protein
VDFGARIYDSRLGRWLSLDPMMAKYAEKTPYHFTSNNPINRIDADGKDDFHFYYLTQAVNFPMPGGGVKTVSWNTNFYTVDRNNKKNTYTVHHLNRVDHDGQIGNVRESTQIVQGADAGKKLLSFNVDRDYPTLISKPGDVRPQDKEVFDLQNGARNVIAGEKRLEQEGKALGLLASVLVPELLSGFGPAIEMTTVGRWMSKAEYNTMSKTGQMVEGAGGQTFVGTGGSEAFTAASKGSVYAEFQVPANSLLQGGQANWFKTIGPNANKAMQGALKKQGGEMLPKIENLSPVLKTK